ncbi:hypothetical protein C4F40_12650 [Sphingobacterium sp. Ka21]|uniref:Crp/Fnr family transcriptional regulator n=2 Tax=Sphingobacterium pedocola TaxID=2082722 RepID=A0ABR9T9J7_9SPHI|nr:hypothetical protein [Sphingobacterium pedocola]
MKQPIDAFQQALLTFHNYDESLWSALRPWSSIKRIRQGSFLPSRSFDAFLVTKGILSLEATDTGNIIHFIGPGCIVPDFYVEESREYHTQQDAILIVLPVNTLTDVHRTHPDLYHLEKDIVREWIRRVLYRQELLDIEKRSRKEKFKKLFPDIPGAIPNVVISSYLAMSREYFGKTGW